MTFVFLLIEERWRRRRTSLVDVADVGQVFFFNSVTSSRFRSMYIDSDIFIFIFHIAIA